MQGVIPPILVCRPKMSGRAHKSKIASKDLSPEKKKTVPRTDACSEFFPSLQLYDSVSRKKFPIIQSLRIVLRNVHVKTIDISLTHKAVDARNQGSESAASDGTMFPLCF